MRLHKALADAGVASRRKAEDIIRDGRVRVNNRVICELGTKVDPHRDRIEVDGRKLIPQKLVTILLNKPRGVVCTVRDPEGRPTVMDYIKGFRERLYPVGRLDFATSGALLLSNDGELSNRLTHPRYGAKKTYLLKIRGQVSAEILKKWRSGVDIGGSVTRPAEAFCVEETDNFTWLEVTLHEGQNRQIRRMGEATGLDVIKLKRISFAGLTIAGLKVGQYRHLTARELARLRKDCGISTKARS
ncbi:MAG: pseudouridine synthase [Myxococcota bacterium]|nr:pseudouridine synthase [Myxococcota bacterium]